MAKDITPEEAKAELEKRSKKVTDEDIQKVIEKERDIEEKIRGAGPLREHLDTAKSPTSVLSLIRTVRDHPDRFLWAVVVIAPMICAILPFELGIDAWTNLLVLVVLSAAAAWQDIQRLNKTQRQAPDVWTLAVMPVYLWQRLTRNSQPLLPLLGWVAASAAAITLSFHAEKQALEDQACQLTTEIIHEQLNGGSDCVTVKIDETVKNGFYRATATLDNGNEISITIDESKDDNVYVRISN